MFILIIVPIIIYGRIMKYKKSRQRERILEILRHTGSHPTADWIYEKLKPDFPRLSMGTVYRNLTILMDQQLVKKIDFGSTYDRFDAHVEPHYHFICEKCGSIQDLPLPLVEGLNSKAAESIGGTVLRHRIEFYGVCSECRSRS